MAARYVEDQMRQAKRRYCWFCGVEIGAYADYDRWDNCGKPECERETREALSEEREEARRQLDDDMGWP
jgi:hypothetical protein